MFSLFVVVFSFIEHIVAALIHGQSVLDGICEITGKGVYELLAFCVLIIAAFLPFFTVKEIENAFGEAKVRGMFFGGHQEETNPPIVSKDQAPKIPSA